MLPNPRNITFKFKRPETGFPDSSLLGHQNTKPQEFVDISSSSTSSAKDSDDENGANSKQIVLYNPPDSDAGAIIPVPEPIENQNQRPRHLGLPFQPSRPLPAVGAFTVQCANCFKWRLIPTKEKYEAIREHILEQPFFCETAREWRPDIKCDDPPDLSQDGSRLWAIDKPNIAQPPLGWQRLLRIRGEGSTKFADVYYVAPSGKRLRSMVEIEKYLIDHPELVRDGLNMSQFSFRTPKPLQENYVRKRPRPLPLPSEHGNRPLEPDLVRPLAWAIPDESTRLQLGMPQLPPSFMSESLDRPAKRPAIGTPSKAMYASDPRFNTDGFDRS